MSDTVQSTRSTSGGRFAPDTARPNRSLVISLTAMAAVFFVGTVVMTLLASSFAGDLNDERDGRDAVESASARFASEFLSYDGAKIDAAKREVGALSTPKLRKELETALDRVAPALEATKARARSTVTGVYVGEVDGDNASTVVTVDVVVSSSEMRESAQQQVLSLGLVKVDGHWQVDAVTNLRATGTTAAPTAP